MRTLSDAAAAHLAGSVTTLAVCWRVTRRDGQLILGTQHDADLVVQTGTYAGTYLASAAITGSSVRSTSDMSVDNMEVNGAVPLDLTLSDLSPADIEAGLFDDAEVVLFLVDWNDPDDWQIVLRTGSIGSISRTSEGQYKTELRGLAQRLTQKIIRTYGSSCDAELGDARCKIDLDVLVVSGTVTAVVNNREFSVAWSGSPQPEAGYFNGGKLTWLTGDNTNFSMEIKNDASMDSPPGSVLLFLPMTRDVQVGDTFEARPGCDKSAAMCKGRFSNLVNFQGYGAWVPGPSELVTFGGQTTERRTTPASFLEWPRAEEP